MTDGRNILVTGGAGYVGSHACKALAAAGYTPVGDDDLCRGQDGAVRFGRPGGGGVTFTGGSEG